MIGHDVELFYYTAKGQIEATRADYLRKQKAIAFQQDLPDVQEATAEELAKMNIFQRIKYRFYLRKDKKRYKKALRHQRRPMDEDLTKGYNAGMEKALKILEFTYGEYKERGVKR